MAMRSAWQRCGWGGVLLIAVSGCLGGQTGQPGSLTCGAEPATDLAATDFVAAFEGTHQATLVWNVSEGATLEDVLTLELRRRDPVDASVGCAGTLEAWADMELTTRDYGLLESRAILLQGERDQLERARILVRGARVTLDADLAVVDGEVRISGTLTTSDNALPAPTATFPSAGE